MEPKDVIKMSVKEGELVILIEKQLYPYPSQATLTGIQPLTMG
jgi:hypothetical protein